MNNHILEVMEMYRASKNMDLMRELIETTLSGLDGRLDKLVTSRVISIDGTCDSIECRTNAARWNIQVYPRMSRRRTVMTCYAGGDPIMHARVLFSSLNDGFDAAQIAFADVEIVFDSLQTVIDTFMERFPVLQADAKIMRSAAKKFPALH